MCGILGHAGPAPTHDRAAFARALNLLSHRGPDDSGTFFENEIALGHRRLSIIDLSVNGHQPMVASGSGAVIVFNGEIYNYLELRQELAARGAAFRTNSDTEVLLQCYLQWGQACLARLNGMWAFTVWRPDARTIFFARDRFGVKPFYYRQLRGSFSFASEPKALLELFPEHRRVDVPTLVSFLAEGNLYAGDRSFYEGIRVLPPAHCGEYNVQTGKLKIWRYWDYPQTLVQNGTDPARDVESFASLLDDGIRLRMRSDVPVGITLSGGLDSTAVLAGAMNAANAKPVCFTSVYSARERGEAEWAVRAAKPYGIAPVEVAAPREQWLETMPDIAWHMDGPGYSPAVYPLWCLMKEARRSGVPVLLEGQGADEAIGGYPQHAIIDLLSRARRARSIGSLADLANTWRGITRCFTWKWSVLWLAREAFPELLTARRRRIGAGATLREDYALARTGSQCSGNQHTGSSTDPVTQRLRMEHAVSVLPGLLHYGDAISMAHGIESRLPFMDYRLVEWLFARDARVKIHRGQTKWVLREFLRRRNQCLIADRPDKKGYPTPTDAWLSSDRGRFAEDMLASENSRISEFCEPQRVRKLVQQHVAGVAGAGNHLYRLLSTEFWLRRCIAR
jgi:asparagine synthase (glutamine-hydrolysing)